MTRSLGSIRTRPTLPCIRVPKRRELDPSIARIGVTCFRLVPILDRDPDDAPYWPVQLQFATRAMGAFTALERDVHISWL